MKFFAVAAFLATAMAAPALEARASVCPSGLLSGNPQCCSVDVLGLADLDCSVPKQSPRDGKDFAKICTADGGKEAMCCGVPVAGQALVCQKAIGA